MSIPDPSELHDLRDPPTHPMTPPITTAELDELELLLRRVPPLPWVWQNGCSFWRLASAVTGKDGDVLNPTRDHDGHPNLSTAYGVQDFIVKLANLAPRLLTAARQQPPAQASGCPCHWTTPCTPRCTCVNPFSSHGCTRCCRYGSDEQRRGMAENIVRKEQQPPAHEQGGEELRAALDAMESCGSDCGSWHGGRCTCGKQAVRSAADKLITGILSRPTQGGGGKAPGYFITDEKLVAFVTALADIVIDWAQDEGVTNEEAKRLVKRIQEAAQAASRGGETTPPVDNQPSPTPH